MRASGKPSFLILKLGRSREGLCAVVDCDRRRMRSSHFCAEHYREIPLRLTEDGMRLS